MELVKRNNLEVLGVDTRGVKINTGGKHIIVYFIVKLNMSFHTTLKERK